MLRAFCIRLYYGLGLAGTSAGNVLRRVARRLGLAGQTFEDDPATIPSERPDTAGILVAFKIGGGIGDHLIAARYVRDLMATVGEFRFDVYSSRPEVTTWLFGHMSQFNRSYDEYFSWHGRRYYQLYALSMWISQFLVLQYETVNWIRLHRERHKLVKVCESIDRFRQARDMNEIIAAHPRLDNLLGLKAVFMNRTRSDISQAMSGIAYGGHALGIAVDPALRSKFGLDNRPYITIHNGFDAEFQTAYGFAKKSTKVYGQFDAVVALLRARYPGLFIVQLGTKTSRPIKGVDLQLIDRTSLADSASVLAGSMLHIDNESGLVHLAACIGAVSCVVFGPTPPAYFGYEGNINIAPRQCGGCWWATKDWMTNCPRGFDEPVCLSATPPEAVADAVITFLDTLDAGAERPDAMRATAALVASTV